MLSVSLSLNGAQTVTPGATINVSNDSAFGQSEMSLVVNPTNPLNVVAFSHRLTTPITLDVYSSSDGGLTWATNRIDNTDDGLGAGGNRFDPALAFDANGVLYIAYGVRGTAGPPATQTRLVGAVSTDGGLNFTNFRVIDAQNDRNGGGTPPPGLDKWYLASGLDPNSGNQAVYVAYVHFAFEGAMNNTADDRIMIAGTRDGGANWTAPFVINDLSILGSSPGSSYACPVVGRLGELAVSWINATSDTVFVDRDMDGLWGGGSLFGLDVTVATGIDVDRAIDLPPAQPERGVNAAPMLEVWRNLGWLFIPVVTRFSGADLDLKVARSTDFGANWTLIPVDSGSGTEFNPWLQVDQLTGAISVLYYTTEGDTSTGNDDVRPRLSSSFDGGSTWSKVFLSSQTSNEGSPLGYGGDYLEYIGLGLRDGTAQALWASRYPGGGTDLDAFTANAAFVSSTGDNRLIINERGNPDDYIVVRQSPVNPAFLEVFVDGVREFTGLSATLDKIIINPGAGVNTINIGTLTGISSITINGTNNPDTINLEALGSGTPLTMVLGGGNDVVTLAPNNPFGVAIINAPVTIYAEGGDDTLNIGSGNADILNANIAFDGGESGGGANNKVVFYDTSPVYTVAYDIGSNFVVRDGLLQPFTLSYFNTQVINLQCGGGADTVHVRTDAVATIQAFGYGGPDTFTVGDGTVGFHPANVFDGGTGVDTITFDDHLASASSTWIIQANLVSFFGGVFAVSTSAFETVDCLAGTGNNTIRVVGAMSQNISINGGDGGDAVVLEHVSNYQDFDASGQGGPAEFHFTMDIDGGSGFNSLTVDDTLDFDRSYAIWPDRMLVDEGAPLGLDFNYDSFQSVTVQSPPNPLQFTPEFHIFGTSSDIPVTHQMTILGSSQADHFVLHPHDAQGNLTINGNLGIGGGAGFDTLVVDDIGSSSPINYSFYNQFGPGTTNIGGLGAAGFGAGQDIESITINAGSGADTIDIDSYKSGTGLAINAGGGIDTLRVSPNTKNLPVDATFITSFNFNGGDGPDFFYLYNDNNILPWTYTRTANFLRTDTALGYSVDWNLQSVEYLDVTGGTQADAFLIQSTPDSSQSFSNAFRGGGGNDSYVIGQSGRTNLIVANVAVVNDGDSDSATVDNSADAIGRTTHIDQYFVGGSAGDNLFGPGGYLYHVNLAGTLSVLLGSGADTVYAQPSSSALVLIAASNPTTAPGDKLTLALAQALSPVVTGTTNGNVTSTNLKTLSWTGIETLASDATTPTVDIVDVAPDPRTNAVSSITINFSEPVVGFSLLNVTLTRSGGGNLLPAAANLTTSNQTQWTLSNLGPLTGTSGTYLLTLNVVGVGTTDLAGNPLTVGATDSWIANIPVIPGDVSGDAYVDLLDIQIVGQNWMTAGPAGDANGDGIVNLVDVQVVGQHWHQGTPPSGGGTGGADGSDPPGQAADSGVAAAAIDAAIADLMFGNPATTSRAVPREGRTEEAAWHDHALAAMADRSRDETLVPRIVIGDDDSGNEGRSPAGDQFAHRAALRRDHRSRLATAGADVVFDSCAARDGMDALRVGAFAVGRPRRHAG